MSYAKGEEKQNIEGISNLSFTCEKTNLVVEPSFKSITFLDELMIIVVDEELKIPIFIAKILPEDFIHI